MSYSIKNTRIRVKDVKQGLTVYVAHPVYGIEKYVVQGKPYLNKHNNSLFVKADMYLDTDVFHASMSLNDAGITEGDSYNGRRAFRKLKQAEAWMAKWSKSPSFIKHHLQHEQWVEDMRLDFFDWEYL